MRSMIGSQHQHVARPVVIHPRKILINGIRGALIPVGIEPLLGRPDLDEFTQLPAQETPALLDMTYQRLGLILGRHSDLPDPAVHAIRQREVDAPEASPEMQCWLAPVSCERAEACSLAAGQHDSDRFSTRFVHWKPPGTYQVGA